ncbi:MAG: hypothetical protein ACI3XR_04810 [Eubacteriales bacterium]
MEDNNYFGGPNPNPDPNSNPSPNPNSDPNPNSAPNQGGYQPGYGNYQGGNGGYGGYQGGPNPCGYGYNGYPQNNPMYVQKPGALEYVSLVLGILSVLVCCSLGPVCIPFGIGAIVFALVGKAKSHRFWGVGIAGLVLGIVGCVFGAIMVLFIMAFLYELGLTLAEFIRECQTGEIFVRLDEYMNSADVEVQVEAIVTAVRSFLR